MGFHSLWKNQRQREIQDSRLKKERKRDHEIITSWKREEKSSIQEFDRLRSLIQDLTNVKDEFFTSLPSLHRRLVNLNSRSHSWLQKKRMKDPNEKTFGAFERRKSSHKEIKRKPTQLNLALEFRNQGLSFECSLLGKKNQTRRAWRKAHLSHKIRENTKTKV